MAQDIPTLSTRVPTVCSPLLSHSHHGDLCRFSSPLSGVSRAPLPSLQLPNKQASVTHSQVLMLELSYWTQFPDSSFLQSNHMCLERKLLLKGSTSLTMRCSSLRHSSLFNPPGGVRPFLLPLASWLTSSAHHSPEAGSEHSHHQVHRYTGSEKPPLADSDCQQL